MMHDVSQLLWYVLCIGGRRGFCPRPPCLGFQPVTVENSRLVVVAVQGARTFKISRATVRPVLSLASKRNINTAKSVRMRPEASSRLVRERFRCHPSPQPCSTGPW